MKRTIPFLLSVLLLVGLFTGLEPAARAEGAFGPEGSVLFEKDGVKVTSAGLDLDPTSGDREPIIWVNIENSGDHDAVLGVSGGSVNGVSVTAVLIDFYMEDGQYYGGNYDFCLTIPAQGSGRYALGYYDSKAPGIDLKTLARLELSFTLAKEEYASPYYTSEPVTIETGESAEPVELASLGTVVLDNEELMIVMGQQDYEDWFGPEVWVYSENKTDHFIGLSASSAAADGHSGEARFFSAVPPHKYGADLMSFGDDIVPLKGFENLNVNFSLHEADTRAGVDGAAPKALDPVSVQYPPQNWGDYENGGMRLEIKPKYNDLLTVETPGDNDILFAVSETASLKAGGFEGAGWIFSIGKISEDRMHEMLCNDMSGAEIFAKGEDGSYYVYYHPTDVRYARETVEQMRQDSAQWTMLHEWAATVPGSFAEKNGLENVSYGNSEVDILLARAAWSKDSSATLSTTEYGPLDARTVDAAPYVAYMLEGRFTESEEKEAPDGEYVVLTLPEEETRVDFFFAPGGYARVVRGDSEWLYQASWWDDSVSFAEVMKGWYYAAAEKAGVKEPGESPDKYCGRWQEKDGGSGTMEITRTLAPGKLKIEGFKSEGDSGESCWSLTAVLGEDGKLAYENGSLMVSSYKDGMYTDETREISGSLSLNDAGELVWPDDPATGKDNSYIHQ